VSDERLRRAIAELRRPVEASPDAVRRVKAVVRAERMRRRRRARRSPWLLPAAAAAVAVLAALVTITIGPERTPSLAGGTPPIAAPAPAPAVRGTPVIGGDRARGAVRAVAFAVAPGPDAERVSLVGDFNGWDPSATPMRRGADGRWTASVPLALGSYTYAFVVNDTTWIADPNAPRAPRSEFGSAGSVLVVDSLRF